MRQAFSLVELSIVLVILGLLTGGILGGQSLIRAAELRSVASDVQRYSSAIYTFRDKYFGFPGDMTNATAFWGVRASTGSDVTCHQTINSTTGTCNGNGDGRIDYIAGDTATYGERFLGWQHLSRAGLIEGNYTGATTTAGAYAVIPGTNVPRSRIAEGQFRLAALAGPISGDTNFFDGPYGFNLFELTGTSSPLLKPEELWNIDTKLDDGRPASGNVFTHKNTSTYSPTCATTDIASTAAYSLNLNNRSCVANVALK
jgi:prepilin-type N-terminal cleavage/methylation domain-containing protein